MVETKDGKKGRTFHSKGLVNEKVPVYLATEEKTYDKGTKHEITIPVAYSDTAILCEPSTLKRIGFID